MEDLEPTDPRTVRRVDLWPQANPGLVYYIHRRPKTFAMRILSETKDEGIKRTLKADYAWAKQWIEQEEAGNDSLKEDYGADEGESFSPQPESSP